MTNERWLPAGGGECCPPAVISLRAPSVNCKNIRGSFAWNSQLVFFFGGGINYETAITNYGPANLV